MKYLVSVFLFLVLHSCCASQSRIGSIDDLHKIKAHEKAYINQSLAFLLKDIQLPITVVLPKPGKDNSGSLGFIRFQFQDTVAIEAIRKKGKQPITVTVFVKEPFTWDFSARPAGEKYAWTTEDAARLGNLTILGIRVAGVKE